MKRFEYKIYKIPAYEHLEEHLNSLGEQRWELVCLHSGPGVQTRLFFKREKLNDQVPMQRENSSAQRDPMMGMQ